MVCKLYLIGMQTSFKCLVGENVGILGIRGEYGGNTGYPTGNQFHANLYHFTRVYLIVAFCNTIPTKLHILLQKQHTTYHPC